jgi:tRNA threonylcarbamoyladenosine biosynthesis protein TsaB
MAEPLLLSLETATLAGSIAVSRGSSILATRVGRPEVSHSNTLLSDIDEILASLDLSIRDIELLAVASGPGSFTGLRIGLATVKALATTLGCDCVGIPTLEAIAHSAGAANAVVALLPAGRGEVFVQMFSTLNSVTALDEAQHLSPGGAIDKYSSRSSIRWAGDGAQLHSDLIEERAKTLGYRFSVHNNGMIDSDSGAWILTKPELILAEHVASLAVKRFQDGLQQKPDSLKAIYVRPSDAELKS